MTAFIDALELLATDTVGNVGLAAIAALGVFAVIFGVRMVLKMFKGASK